MTDTAKWVSAPADTYQQAYDYMLDGQRIGYVWASIQPFVHTVLAFGYVGDLMSDEFQSIKDAKAWVEKTIADAL